MSNQLFVDTKEFGRLYIDEVFVYYDMPLIFSLINPLGYRYICIFESEDVESETYLLVPISFIRFQQLVSNTITIREIFEKPEMGEVLAVNIRAGGVNSCFLSCEEVLHRNLPPADEYLDIKESYTKSELIRKAEEKRCGIVQISFEKEGTHKHSIKARELSVITAKLQKVIGSIEKDWRDGEGANASKERIKKMARAADINITRTYAASFGIELESEDCRDLFDESEFDYLMQQFLDVNDKCNDMTSAYYETHKKTVTAIRDYYKALMTNRFAVKMQAALPNKKIGKLYCSIDDITKKYSYLTSVIDGRTEQIKITGHLVAFDIKANTFKFQVKDGELISGRIDEDFSETVFDIANEITVLVNKKIEILAPGDESDKYELLSIITQPE